MNLPEFGSKFNKGCKVFALSLAMLACAACGGGETAEETPNSPVSSEVEVSESTNTEAPASENGENTESATEENTEVTDAGTASSGEGTGDGTAVEPAQGTEVAADKAAAEQKKAAPVRRKVSVRDPFLNMVVGPASVSNARLSKMSAAQRAALQRSQKKAVTNTSASKAKQAAKKVVKVVKPSITVNGILRGGHGYEAMISDGRQTRLVAVGEKVDKYRILDINPKAKTVTIGLGKEHKFCYTLEKEQFGDAKK